MSAIVDRELQFGYFFTDPSPRRLSAFAKAAEALGYRTVALYRDEEREDLPTEIAWRLHLSRVTRNSEAHAQRMELVALGRAHEVDVFDGWEMGAVSGSRHVRLSSQAS